MLAFSNSELITERNLLQSAIGFRIIRHEIGVLQLD